MDHGRTKYGDEPPQHAKWCRASPRGNLPQKDEISKAQQVRRSSTMIRTHVLSRLLRDKQIFKTASARVYMPADVTRDNDCAFWFCCPKMMMINQCQPSIATTLSLCSHFLTSAVVLAATRAPTSRRAGRLRWCVANSINSSPCKSAMAGLCAGSWCQHDAMRLPHACQTSMAFPERSST